MEILVGIIVLLTLIFCVTGEVGAVISAILALIVLFSLAVLGFFLIALCHMLHAEKKSARFLRIERSGHGGFERAVYEVDGGEYPDAFPAEPVFRDRLYRMDRAVKLRFSEKRKTVYDRNTVVTVWCGLAAFLPLSVWLMYAAIHMVLYARPGFFSL